MNITELISYMQTHPWTKRQGASFIANRTHSSIGDVRNAKIKVFNSDRKLPKILIFDIETSPMKAYVWKRWKENISLDQTISEWFVICWSAKWLYSSEVLGDVVTPEEAIHEDDKRVVTSLWKLFNEADIVVAHNGKRFDVPKMNSRFICNDLPPTTPYYIIDTLEVAKKQFGFSSNKLDALATYFGFDHKLDTDFNLWKTCLEGNQESLNYMLEYNKRDVTLLEEVYLKLRPWIKNHPNLGNYDNNSMVCSNCGSSNLLLLQDKYYKTQIGTYNLYRCQCGCVSRGRVNLNKNKVQTISILK